jgi:hypothetical protein
MITEYILSVIGTASLQYYEMDLNNYKNLIATMAIDIESICHAGNLQSVVASPMTSLTRSLLGKCVLGK